MGKEHQGGKSAMVQDQLKNIQQIHTTERAFAAILADGSVVTWGDPYWGGTAAQSEISSNICSKLWHYFCCEQVAACYILVPRCAPSHSVEVALQEERRMVLRVVLSVL